MGLWRLGISLYRNSVRGIWRVDCLAGDSEGYVEKALELGISIHKGHDGEPGKGLIYWGL